MLTIDFETHRWGDIYIPTKKTSTHETFEAAVEAVCEFMRREAGRFPNEQFEVTNSTDRRMYNPDIYIHEVDALAEELLVRGRVIEVGGRIYVRVELDGTTNYGRAGLHTIMLYDVEEIQRRRERIIAEFGDVCRCGCDECDHDCGTLRCGCIDYCECRSERRSRGRGW
jgi:hypothetical protein